VFKGKIAYRFGDREETYEAGDAYYVPPGHVPLAFEGSEILQFQPADEMAKTTEAMARNMQAVGAPPGA
jgi:quercetin dioxygenase-like cupin family protein